MRPLRFRRSRSGDSPRSCELDFYPVIEMATKMPIDVFALQRQLVSRLETGLNEFLTEHMSSSEFGKRMSKVTASTQLLRPFGKTLEHVTVATKSDIASLSERIKVVEDQ